MTTATNEAVRVIWKCRNKNCKHVWAYDYQPATGRNNEYRYLADGTKRYLVEDHMNELRCPECNCSLPNGTRVKGVYNEKHACNAKCMSSTSGVCSCSCGGKNHGAGHL